MSKRWFIRIDCYCVDKFLYGADKIYFRIDKENLSVKMFEGNFDGSLRITDFGFVSDSFINLEAKYSRYIKANFLSNKLVSRFYIYTNDKDFSNFFDLIKR